MDMHPCAGCHDPKYEHHWLVIERMAAFDCALNQSVPGYRTGREQYNTCVGFHGVVPHAHETRGREDTGEGAEPARCAVLVTGCAEQQERQPQQRKQQWRSRSPSPLRYASGSTSYAVGAAGNALGTMACSFPATGCKHEWSQGDSGPVAHSVSKLGHGYN